MEASHKGSFRYNGADLTLMKRIANTDNPQTAVEYFIERAIREGKLPQDLLADAWKEEERYDEHA